MEPMLKGALVKVASWRRLLCARRNFLMEGDG
jgi:hypothetical protein